MNKKDIMMLLVLMINKVLVSEVYDRNPYGFFEEQRPNHEEADEEIAKRLQQEEYYLLEKQRLQESADSMYAKEIEREQREEKANKEKEFQKLMGNTMHVLKRQLEKLNGASTPEKAAEILAYISKVAIDRRNECGKY